jgi:hypothetical protein
LRLPNISYWDWCAWLDTFAAAHVAPVVECAMNELTMFVPDDTARPAASRMLPIGYCTE